jgi:hypothetical protein
MKHYDCKYYLATDVFKGICKRDKSNIQADDKACDHFEKIPKCKYCSHYSRAETDLGLCMKKSVAYPEMIALTCHDFSWN